MMLSKQTIELAIEDMRKSYYDKLMIGVRREEDNRILHDEYDAAIRELEAELDRSEDGGK